MKDEIIVGAVVGAIVGWVPVIVGYLMNPSLEKKILKEKEIWMKKREVFSNAMELVAKQWDSEKLTGPGSENHIPIKEKPTSIEKNRILAQLYMLAQNPSIPDTFMKVIDGKRTAKDIGNFNKILRRELGLSDLSIDSDKMAMFYNVEPNK